MKALALALLLLTAIPAAATVVGLPCDDAAIRTAYAEALRVDHILEFPDGATCTTRGLVIDSVNGFTVRATGATLQLAPNTLTLSTAVPVITVVRSGNVRIAGLRVDGNRRAQGPHSEWNAGIWVESTTNVWLDGLVVFNTGGDGVYLYNGVNAFVRNSVINDVRPIDAYGPARQGVAVTHGLGISITGNIFYGDGAGDCAIDLEPDAPYGWVGWVTVSGNIVHPSGWRWAFGMNGTGDYGTVNATGNIWGGHPTLVTKPATLTGVGNAP